MLTIRLTPVPAVSSAHISEALTGMFYTSPNRPTIVFTVGYGTTRQKAGTTGTLGTSRPACQTRPLDN